MAVENRGPQLEAVAALFLILSWIFVSLRVYVRTVMIKNFGADDWLAVASLILFTLYCSFVFKGIEYGTGQHFANLPPEHIPIAVKWWWWCELSYISSTTVLKICIGVFLFRIAVKRTHKWVIYVVLAVVIAFNLGYFFLLLFQCSPPQYFWTQYLGDRGKCVPSDVITGTTYAHSAISAWADWTLGTLPVFLVRDSAMTPRVKVVVALILALGAVGSTATIVRIPFIHQLALNDFLYSTTDVAIWSTVEPGIGITASSLATLRPLFRTFFSRKNLFGGTSSRTRSNSNSNPFEGNLSNKRSGYVHSSSATKDLGGSGYRGEIDRDSGVTTKIIIQGRGDIEGQSVKMDDLKKMESGKKLKWCSHNELRGESVSVRALKDDSSEEFLPVQMHGSWCVRKTTEVRTQSEPKGGR